MEPSRESFVAVPAAIAVAAAALLLTVPLGARQGRPAVVPPAGAPSVSAKSGAPPSPVRTVVKRAGEDSVHTWRIPGLAATPAGTLIAVFDMRRKGSGDLPADIDVGATRSTDNGATWGPTTVVLDFDAAEGGAMGNGVGDPAVLVDDRTGRIIVAALWSRGDRGWQGSGPGLSPDETGQLVMSHSDDDGLTWSPPRNVTAAVAGRNPRWRLFFTGPGRGLRLTGGALVFAAQYRDADGTPRSCFLYSTDGGGSWAASAAAIPDGVPTSEAQIAELPDGSLLMSMRNESRSGKRAWARYAWTDSLANGAWSEPWFAVTDPTCMASLVRHPIGLLLHSNPNSAAERVALTVRASVDGGRIWTDGRVIDPGPSGYSCMAVLPDGSVGVLYEAGRATELETLTFARFTIDWLLGE